jgi:putative ABC transport system permease protein
LFAAVGLVLLIASANVANLLLMRGEGRRAEFAVRAALGAGRSRLVRQVLAESVLLSALAGVVGVATTWWSLQALIAGLPEGLPRLESVRVDGVVVLFSIGVVFVTALLAGLGPGLLSMPANLPSQLRSGGRGITGSTATRGRRTLVTAQVALAVTIVAAAGLLIRSVLRLQSVDLGLPADRLVIVDLHLPQADYAERRQHAQLLDDLIAQLEAAPAISAATPVNVSPFSGQGWDLPRFTADGQSDDEAAANPSLNLESVHPNYFETFEIALLRGRAFTAADREGTLDVAIVSEDVAARTWPGENAVGKRLKIGRRSADGPWHTVVGVAAQTRYRDVARPRPTLYLPAAQFQMTATMLVLRTTATIDVIAAMARERVGRVDPDVRVMRVVPFADMLERPLARPRFNAFLLGVFAVVALLLAAVGLYAAMAAYVRQRDQEIAVRLALGATAGGVRRLVLTEAVRLAGFGAMIGLAGAMASTRLIRGLLYEVDPLDPLAIAGSAVLLVGVSAIASYLPARHATRVDATAMLRSQ